MNVHLLVFLRSGKIVKVMQKNCNSVEQTLESFREEINLAVCENNWVIAANSFIDPNEIIAVQSLEEPEETQICITNCVGSEQSFITTAANKSQEVSISAETNSTELLKVENDAEDTTSDSQELRNISIPEWAKEIQELKNITEDELTKLEYRTLPIDAEFKLKYISKFFADKARTIQTYECEENNTKEASVAIDIQNMYFKFINKDGKSELRWAFTDADKRFVDKLVNKLVSDRFVRYKKEVESDKQEKQINENEELMQRLLDYLFQ